MGIFYGAARDRLVCKKGGIAQVSDRSLRIILALSLLLPFPVHFHFQSSIYIGSIPAQAAEPCGLQMDAHGELILDAEGWSQTIPCSDSRIIYVSSSSGSDSNDGLSSTNPKRSLGGGMAVLRDGMSDWLLLKRGDIWTESLYIGKNGRDSRERLVIGYYGENSNRPRINEKTVTVDADYVAIVGLHLEGPANQDAVEGVYFKLYLEDATRSPHHILIEDMRIEGRKIGINSSAGRGRNSNVGPNSVGANDIVIRRNVIADSVDEGLYTRDNRNVLLEQNVFDNNGHKAGLNERPGHNIYKSINTTNFVARENIFSRAGELGLKWRAASLGGGAYNNLFVRNRNGMAIHVDTEDPNTFMNENLEVVDNVFLDIGRDTRSEHLGLEHLNNVLIQDNIMAQSTITTGSTMKLKNVLN